MVTLMAKVIKMVEKFRNQIIYTMHHFFLT